jgi:D-alanyl-D-alanine carboxypeptidase/D-alanyl-D-alanine-endopeptidase (penicillin-binding protein 4)
VTGRLLAAALGGLVAVLPLSARQQAAVPSNLPSDLDRILDAPALVRALVAARIDALGPRGAAGTAPRLVYARNADRLVVPGSNLKLLTIAVAADVLGWDYRYSTRLDAIGTISGGVLTGDLIVTGSGDPSIGSADGGPAPVFLEWADTLRQAGIRRVDGRLIGDDNAFEDRGLGTGWAWDNLAAGYSSPAGALNFNENAVVARVTAGSAPGRTARVELSPDGHGLHFRSEVETTASSTAVDLAFLRTPNDRALTLRGTVPLSDTPVLRTASVDNPTQFFVDALALALASRGITIAGGAWDIDNVDALAVGPRHTVAVHASEPFSVLAGTSLKESQNVYAETFLKTVGRVRSGQGTSASGLEVVRTRAAAWGIPADALVLYDGSGLSRYNYVSASSIVSVLTHVWQSDVLRGPFVAGLPVGGQDGTLSLRMRGTALSRHVQAKTGTLNHVRALSGFVERQDGERLVFSIIVNHYTAPGSEIDGIVERTLARLLR